MAARIKQRLYEGLLYMQEEGRRPLDLNLCRELHFTGLIGKRGDGANTTWSITKSGEDLIHEMSTAAAVKQLTVLAAGINLDEAVDAMKSAEASQLNNEGTAKQVAYLIGAGGVAYTEGTIRALIHLAKESK